MLDFSNKPELRSLSALAAAFRAGAGTAPFFLAGASARDLLLYYAHGIDSGRRTRDVDLALMVPDWATFDAIRARLTASGAFTAASSEPHRLWFDGKLPVDLIPFGAVEQADRSIAWPPDGNVVMNVLGFAEAFAHTHAVALPDGEQIRIVSLPGLAVLKLVAWKERRLTQPGKDAHDLAVILSNYLEAGNQERLYTNAAHLLDAPDFDVEQAGAWLLGQDMAAALPMTGRQAMAALLREESDPTGPARLAGDMPMNAGHALVLMGCLNQGFLGTITP